MSDSARFSSPHVSDNTSVRMIMLQVSVALVPGILCYAWIMGWGVILQCLLAILFATALESIVLLIRRIPVKPFLFDGSTVVTALLFAICLSPYAPWWANLTGITFGVIIIKHCYGGLGQNIFNPAMAGYVFTLLCFPMELSIYPDPRNYPGFLDTIRIINGNFPHYPDAITGATVLSTLKSGLHGMKMISEISQSPVFGVLAGRSTEWITTLWFAGGIFLIVRKIIKWQVPVVFLGTMFLISLVFYWFDSSHYPSPVFTLFAGGSMLAAFFIITEPVSSSTTPAGRLLFAAGTAIIAYIIRTWGNYPDGIAFAVLIMNFSAPLLDRMTRPRVLGET